MEDLNRREFIRKTTLIVAAVSLSFESCKEDKQDPLKQTPPKTNCSTTADILGPFYKSGAPFREDIIPIQNTSAPLIVKGKVFTDCDAVLKDAMVEIWNANDAGEYDTSAEFKFRGRFLTEANGVYRFKTIIPGRYLNGNTFRPSHIHFRITAPGHQELVSQIYFKDDPFIGNDPWAGSAKASERILALEKDANGLDTVNFNIYLIP
jgi:catechol 1,2-dioxygenase